MKPLTNYEICDKLPCRGYTIDEVVKLARIGMIPEAEAIRVPPEKDWPKKNEDGTHILGVGVVFTTCEDERHFKEMWGDCAIQYIPRSKPAWVPKVGEAVFTANMHLDVVRYGVVTVVANGGVGVIFPDGSTSEYTFDHVKPGVASYIGKPWSEIPEGY